MHYSQIVSSFSLLKFECLGDVIVIGNWYSFYVIEKSTSKYFSIHYCLLSN